MITLQQIKNIAYDIKHDNHKRINKFLSNNEKLNLDDEKKWNGLAAMYEMGVCDGLNMLIRHLEEITESDTDSNINDLHWNI